MKLGLHYWNFSTPPESAKIAPTLATTARIAEQAGVSSFTVMDHYAADLPADVEPGQRSVPWPALPVDRDAQLTETLS